MVIPYVGGQLLIWQIHGATRRIKHSVWRYLTSLFSDLASFCFPCFFRAWLMLLVLLVVSHYSVLLSTSVYDQIRLFLPALPFASFQTAPLWLSLSISFRIYISAYVCVFTLRCSLFRLYLCVCRYIYKAMYTFRGSYWNMITKLAAVASVSSVAASALAATVTPLWKTS